MLGSWGSLGTVDLTARGGTVWYVRATGLVLSQRIQVYRCHDFQVERQMRHLGRGGGMGGRSGGQDLPRRAARLESLVLKEMATEQLCDIGWMGVRGVLRVAN